MAAGTQNTVLLRRPLPPLQKREDHINTKKKQTKGLIDTISSKKQALISANNQVSREKFSKNQEEGNEKMKVIERQVPLKFYRKSGWSLNPSASISDVSISFVINDRSCPL